MSDGESLAAKGRELEFSQATPTPPPDAQAMTRDEVMAALHRVWEINDQAGFDLVRDHDAAQRETIRRLEAELKRVNDSYDTDMQHWQARLTASEAKYKWTTPGEE